MPKIIDRGERRLEIARAAISVFIECGYERASISQIAQASGIAKATVYDYFRTKEELLVFSLEQWILEIGKQAEREVASVNDPSKQLVGYAYSALDAFLKDDRRMGKLLFRVIDIMLDDGSIFRRENLFLKMIAPSMAYLEKVIEDGVRKRAFRAEVLEEKTLIIKNLMAYLDGISLHDLVTDGYIDIRKQIESYMKYFIAGLER